MRLTIVPAAAWVPRKRLKRNQICQSIRNDRVRVAANSLSGVERACATCTSSTELEPCQHPACHALACRRCGDWLVRGARKGRRVWLCYECHTRCCRRVEDVHCEKCFDDEGIVECVGCDRWWHGLCHEPALRFPDNIASLNWLCSSCSPFRQSLAELFDGVHEVADYDERELSAAPDGVLPISSSSPATQMIREKSSRRKRSNLGTAASSRARGVSAAVRAAADDNASPFRARGRKRGFSIES